MSWNTLEIELVSAGSLTLVPFQRTTQRILHRNTHHATVRDTLCSKVIHSSLTPVCAPSRTHRQLHKRKMANFEVVVCFDVHRKDRI